jgi:hypothetical protein
MTEIEELVRLELERRYPVADSAPDWDDVVARHARASPPRARRRPLRLALAACLAAAIAALVVTAPWRGGSSFEQEALAAVGTGRYVHAVLEPTVADTWLIDLSTGRARPVLPRIEWTYDSRTGAYAARARAHRLVFDASSTTPDPGVTRFATGYRRALATGEARILRTTVVGGRAASVLRFTFHEPDGSVLGFEDVAVSDSSHRPLSITYVAPDPHAPPHTYRVVSIGTSEAPVPLPDVRGPEAAPPITGDAADIRTLAAGTAGVALQHAALWAGQRVGAARLVRIRLQRVRTVLVAGFRTRSADRGLRLEYRGGAVPLVIEEAATPQKGYGYDSATFGGSGFVPPPGRATIACVGGDGNGCTGAGPPLWQAQLRAHGLFVTIRSQSRALVIRAARALVPIP